jgi:hypothetical protein
VVIESLTKLTVRLRDGRRIRLEPGRPVSLDEENGRRLLERAPNKVRLVPSAAPEGRPCPWTADDDTRTQESRSGGFLAEPASARLVYWETGDGRILTGRLVLRGWDQRDDTYWVGVEHDGGFSWVRSDRLRSRADYETQQPLRPTEPVREAR